MNPPTIGPQMGQPVAPYPTSQQAGVQTSTRQYQRQKFANTSVWAPVCLTIFSAISLGLLASLFEVPLFYKSYSGSNPGKDYYAEDLGDLLSVIVLAMLSFCIGIAVHIVCIIIYAIMPSTMSTDQSDLLTRVVPIAVHIVTGIVGLILVFVTVVGVTFSIGWYCSEDECEADERDGYTILWVAILFTAATACPGCCIMCCTRPPASLEIQAHQQVMQPMQPMR